MGSLAGWREVRWLVACVCVIAPLTYGGAALASAAHNHVTMKVSPNTGKFGSPYTVTATGSDNRTGVTLELTTDTAGHPCPSSYTGGFAELSGLSNRHGGPIAPIPVRKGSFSKTVKAKWTINVLGPHAMCAYLTRGSTTLAHGSAKFTVTM
jgi:hypothetical protein